MAELAPRAQRLTLLAMTLALSMVLVDQTAVPLALPELTDALDGSAASSTWVLTANILPIAALMLLGGRLGDLFGLRRVFLAGAATFLVATALTGAAQEMAWMLSTRVLQGVGAALMVPTAVAIVSGVYPAERRGFALGVLAGGSAVFAALGPLLGGLLTSIDWRLVFLVNVPLALAAIVLTRRFTPPLRSARRGPRTIDWAGVATFGAGVAAFVFGLSQGQVDGWSTGPAILGLAVGLLALALFVRIELRSPAPLLELRLFRHRNFLAANISQFLAGTIELGLGYLLPYYLLLVVGTDPVTAGIALIPGTVPILLAGPLGGRWFDRVGGRTPLVAGFGVLAASGVVLAVSVGSASAWALVPGLLLQGVGLGLVLTVNDPTGLMAVPERHRGQAAGMLNTAEQMGGAVGIAGLSSIELARNFAVLDEQLRRLGIDPTPEQMERGRAFVQRAEELGLRRASEESPDAFARVVSDAIVHSHIAAFELMLSVSAALALLGAVACLLLVRAGDRDGEMHVVTRRSRWRYGAGSEAAAAAEAAEEDDP